MTREEIIQKFVDPTSGIDVLIANPAACAESTLSAQDVLPCHLLRHVLQLANSSSLPPRSASIAWVDRRKSPPYYHFLQYNNSIDHDILTNVQKKAQSMSAIIDKDYPIYSLDMFAEDDEAEAYERLFGNRVSAFVGLHEPQISILFSLLQESGVRNIDYIKRRYLELHDLKALYIS